MNRLLIPFLSATILSSMMAHGQDQLQAPPFQKEEDRAKLRLQSGELFDAVSPITQQAGKSAVWIWFDKKKLLAIGTVIGDGNFILTKWSEVANYKDKPLQCVTGDGKTIAASISSVYEDEDIALLTINGEPLPGIKFSPQPDPPMGSFLIAAGPGDTPLALGVVSVNERSLRTSDQAFAGVATKKYAKGNGVEVEQVIDESPADLAGVKKGDIILKIDDAIINDVTEFRAVITKSKPQQTVTLTIQRSGQEQSLPIKLASKQAENQMLLRQTEVMERMGGEISKVRDGFPAIIQTDMVLNPEECGSPVYDLKGRPVGLLIARSGRIRSYMISSSRIAAMLENNGIDPSLAKVRKPERAPTLARNRAVLPRLDRDQMENMRSRMMEMKKFMKQLDAEILELDR